MSEGVMLSLTFTDVISVILGVVAVGVACVAIILEIYHSSQVRKHNIAEKTAVLWNYANLATANQLTEYSFKQILSDIIALRAMKPEIRGQEGAMLIEAGNRMFDALEKIGYGYQPTIIQARREFTALFQ